MRKEGFTPERYENPGRVANSDLNKLLEDERMKALLTKFTQEWSLENRSDEN